MSNKQLKVGVVGGTGYTGVEVLRLLATHPQAQITCVTSRSDAGVRVSDIYQSLRGIIDISFSEPEIVNLAQCDVVFFATPNGITMTKAKALLDRGVKVIDLAADFRIKDISIWEKWYGMKHACPALVTEAVYGLPEVNREKIKTANLIANPGCYSTAVQLGFIPLLAGDVIDTDSLVADVKSGVSGAGRQTAIGALFSEAADSFKAYAADGHRHLPEIKQELMHAANKGVDLTFVPHLIPMVRGIHATLYAKAKKKTDLQALFESHYAHERFVDVMPKGSHPETRSVKGSNQCRIAVHQPQEGDMIVVLSVIDNLVKGAAGQAVQNMNLMFDLEEDLGLRAVPLMP